MGPKGYYKNIDLKALARHYRSGQKMAQLEAIFRADNNTIRSRLRDLGFKFRKNHKRRVKKQLFQGQNWLKAMKARCYWMDDRSWSERDLHGEHARMERSHG